VRLQKAQPLLGSRSAIKLYILGRGVN
jgi:hypothetical protein